MAGERFLTQDPETIRRWAEERNARPSTVASTRSDDDAGLIRLDFPGYSGGDSLEAISWDDWLAKFEDSDLVLLYQETTSDGEQSNFNKLVSRSTADDASSNAKWVDGSNGRGRSD